MTYTTEQRTATSTYYTFTEQNRRGERLTVEITECRPDNRSKNSLPNLWQKAGRTKKRLESYFSVATYATDADGYCWGRYNPQEETADGKPQHVINFDWMLEVTEQNRERLLRECYNRFINA